MNPLYNYTLKLADDTLIFGQRLGELCGQGPYLEEDIALLKPPVFSAHIKLLNLIIMITQK